MISRLVLNGLEPLWLLLTRLTDISLFFRGDVYSVHLLLDRCLLCEVVEGRS